MKQPVLMGREQTKQIVFYHCNTAKIYKLRNGISSILSWVGLLRSDYVAAGLMNQVWSSFTTSVFMLGISININLTCSMLPLNLMQDHHELNSCLTKQTIFYSYYIRSFGVLTYIWLL